MAFSNRRIQRRVEQVVMSVAYPPLPAYALWNDVIYVLSKTRQFGDTQWILPVSVPLSMFM